MTSECAEASGGGARAASSAPEVTIRPEPQAWRGLVAKSVSEEPARQFRRELGLPDDRPVIMSGHQAQVWHPGILAKLMAIRAAADVLGAAAAWVVVDHDENDPLQVRAPYIGGDGRLGVATFEPPEGEEGVPACRRPAWGAAEAWGFPSSSKEAAPGVVAGMGRIRAAFIRHMGAGDAASQATAAAFELAREDGETGMPVAVRATELARTSLFGELVRKMRENPRACVEAHNAAVSAFPRDRIAPLAIDGESCELPLWTIGGAMGSVRRKVFSTELSTLPVESLAPKALLLTGLMRLAGCELFIHGLGGERYDRITELWLDRWLGRALAPTAMVTATMWVRAPGCWPSTEQIARAAWVAHRAQHDPSMVNDAARGKEKTELVERIRMSPRKSAERSELYRALHTILREARAEHEGALLKLEQQAGAMQARAGESAIASDRTWPFPLYEADQLAALGAAVRGRFA